MPGRIQHIHYQPGFKKHYAYAVLTMKGSIIRHSISKLQRFHISWFHKKDVFSNDNSGFNIFCHRIIDIGSDAFFRQHTIPDSKVWLDGIKTRVVPGLSFYYRLHLESYDYDQAEDNINKLTIENIDNYLRNEKLTGTFEIQGSLVLSSSFSNARSLLEKFRHNILLTRRIFLVMYLIHEKTDDDIYKVFREATITKKEEIRISNKTGLFTTHLGLSLQLQKWLNDPKKLFSSGLLDEEIKLIRTLAYSNNGNTITKVSEKVSDFEIKSNDHKLLTNFADDITSIDDSQIPKLCKVLYKKTYSYNDISTFTNKMDSLLQKNPDLRNVFIKTTWLFFSNDEGFKNLSAKAKGIIKKLKYN